MLAKACQAGGRKVSYGGLLVLAIFWAGSSEWIQGVMANGRTMDRWDALADIVGAMGGLGLVAFINQANKG